MPISDHYIVQYLLQGTRHATQPIVWREADGEGYTSATRGVELHLNHVANRGGARIRLSLATPAGEVHISEPPNIGLFGARYRTEDDRQLASLLKELAAEVSNQCADRDNRSRATTGAIRQFVYQRLIGALD